MPHKEGDGSASRCIFILVVAELVLAARVDFVLAAHPETAGAPSSFGMKSSECLASGAGQCSDVLHGVQYPLIHCSKGFIQPHSPFPSDTAVACCAMLFPQVSLNDIDFDDPHAFGLASTD
jgi:hypothetical protein